MPGLASAPADLVQGIRVLGGFLRQPESGGSNRAIRLAAVEAQVPLYLPPLLLEEHGEENPAAHPPREPGPEPRPSRWRRHSDDMPVLGQQRSPHLHVTILHSGELPVDVCFPRVALGAGQLPI
jgi:hypothetical protein